jgi:hypothetical protein
MDLSGGRYPAYEEEWLLDGSPASPYRRTINRRDITVVTITLATTILNVYAIPVQQGDIFDFVAFNVKTQATATASHSWVALYNGVGTGAALLGQTTDVTAGWAAGAQHLQFTAAAANIATEGIPQGPNTGPIVASGPAVWGLAFYNVTSGTGTILDGMAGGSVNGEQAISTQIPLVSTATVSSTATAPAVLPTMAAASAGIPYALLSAS